MDTVSRTKSMAKALRLSLADRGLKLSHSECLEIVSRQLGFPDWNTCKAVAEKNMTISSTIFVEHGREYETALFYEKAFGATISQKHAINGEVIAIDLMQQGVAISVAGSNPRREAEPWRGGPFFPKEPGSVSAVMRLEVKNAFAVLDKAKESGAIEREALQIDADGHRLAVIVDPFGHMWAIRERAPVRHAAA
jgi:PhnB protein